MSAPPLLRAGLRPRQGLAHRVASWLPSWLASRLASWLATVCLIMAALLCAGPALAQTLESALSPGPVISGHADVEGECAKCHVRFDRAGQERQCMACHKDVGQDRREGTGLHGKDGPSRNQVCRSCHTDHRGRNAKVAAFDHKAFDHKLTDYALKGKHVGPECKSCHLAGKKFRQAPHDCLACHAKDDKHKGTLGKACADCHAEQGWKETRFDHGKTRYPLTGKHIEVKCDACHKTAVYNEAPSTCIACHRKEDKHKARYGDKCDSCHGTSLWKTVSFRHDVDTKYVLRGKHRETRCDSCHTGHLYRDKLGSECISCHRKDDKHKGTLGSECVACHTERVWTEIARFDHDRSNFPLRGGHVVPSCKDCHSSPMYKQTPSECLACHRKDDKHEGTLGPACADCHSDANWKATRFDHARTRFALKGGHGVPPLRCEACHTTPKSYRPTALECISCHRKDDKHEAQLGTRCESCHNESNWRSTRFDHARARFVLAGAHVTVACKSCHASPRYRDAARDCMGCHAKDDKHKAAFGDKCESCHNVRDWRLWTFDHERRAAYALEGSHARLACHSCHSRPAPAGQSAAVLGRDCQGCHRRDDVHDGAFGARCEQCHRATSWKDVSKRTRLPAAPLAQARRAAAAAPATTAAPRGSP